MNKRNKKTKAVSKVAGGTEAFFYFDPCYFDLDHRHFLHHHCCFQLKDIMIVRNLEWQVQKAFENVS